jgi:acetyl esterase/lipase
MRKVISVGLACVGLLATAAAGAQQPPTPAMPFASRQIIPLWDGKPPGTAPNLLAPPIYGAPLGAMPNIPSGTPPAFIAVAEDDPIAAAPVLKFFDALRAAKAAPELHVFRSGQRGFSMSQRNGTSDHWIEELYWWMESYGLTHP